jgi:hypothetical protein
MKVMWAGVEGFGKVGLKQKLVGEWDRSDFTTFSRITFFFERERKRRNSNARFNGLG